MRKSFLLGSGLKAARFNAVGDQGDLGAGIVRCFSQPIDYRVAVGNHFGTAI